MNAYPFPRSPKYLLRVKKCASGFGIFAEEDIPAHRFILEYWGKLVENKAADQVGGRY